jgi:protein TonB
MKPAGRRWWLTPLRWGACFALALLVHGAAAMAVLARWHDSDDLTSNAPVITIDLSPIAAAPQITPTEVPPGLIESQASPDLKPIEEKPIETAEADPEVAQEKPIEEVQPITSEPALAVLPPPKPPEKKVEKKKQKRHKKRPSVASAPTSAERRADRAAAPAPGAASNNPRAVPNWKSDLVARLERYKRYPPEAQSRGEQGVARIAFSVDRSGGVHGARIVGSSGSRLLDDATLALVQRAAPLPPPPPDLPGRQIAITVPIRYHVR